MLRDTNRDVLKQAASAQSERAFARFFDTAASSLELEIIGEPNCIHLLHKLFSQVRVNYRNLPSALLEIDRTLKKYGAHTVDELEAEQRKFEAEQEAEENGEEGDAEESEGGNSDDGTIDDGEAFVNGEEE